MGFARRFHRFLYSGTYRWIQRMIVVWLTCTPPLEDDEYSPQYDSAVRDWAGRSPDVACRVYRVDNERIRLIERIFHNLL